MNNNHLYTHVVINHDWEKVSQDSDPELWSMLTDDKDNTNETEEEHLTDDSDDENNENEQIHKHGIPHPTVIGNVVAVSGRAQLLSEVVSDKNEKVR